MSDNNGNNGYHYNNNNNNGVLPNNGTPVAAGPRTRPLVTASNYGNLISRLNLPNVPRAARVLVPPFKPGTDPENLAAFNRSRRESGAVALRNVKDQLNQYNEEGAQKLLYRVALDDILNHMRSVAYDEMAIAVVQSLADELDSLLTTGGPLTEDIKTRIKEQIETYYQPPPGAIYRNAVKYYMNKAQSNLTRGKAASRIAALYRGKKGRNVARTMRNERNAAAAAAAAAVANKAAKNAARKAALLRMYGPGKTRRNRRNSRRN